MPTQPINHLRGSEASRSCLILLHLKAIKVARHTTPVHSQEQQLSLLRTNIQRRECFNVRSGCIRMANSLPRTMSTREQRNEPNPSTQAAGGQQLTAANLAAHNRNTATMTTSHAVRSWLDDTVVSGGRHVDDETWRRLAARDRMAADIEAALSGGNQNGAGQR